MRKKSNRIIVFCLLAAVIAGIAAFFKYKRIRSPNVVFIIVDTLRADHLGCYGYGRNTSPNIDALAEDSVQFMNAISQAPWTAPSIASMFTAQYPATLGYEGEPIILEEEFTTLAEVFKQHGYTTGAIVSSSFLSSDCGFDQGFDIYMGHPNSGCKGVTSQLVSEKAIDFIKSNNNKRFFLFIHYFDPHNDYFLHDEYDFDPDYTGPIQSGHSISDLRKRAHTMPDKDIGHVKALYDSEIRYTDEKIGMVVTVLKKSGLYDNTIIVVTADHGEEFCDRPYRWIGHSTDVYKELLHVPLIIKLPQNKVRAKVEAYVSLIHVAPTLTGLARLRMPTGYKHEGTYLDVYNPSAISAAPIFSETHVAKTLQAVIMGDYKYIDNVTARTEELYDLKDDPYEKHNIIGKKPAVLTAVRTRLDEFNKDIHQKKTKTAVRHPLYDEYEKERLRALGYIQ